MSWAWFILVTVYGACIGSFLNVLIYRLPEGKSLITPPSSCPGCNTSIAWFDNIPVVSWILLGAKCRKCGMSISAQYPLIEALTAFLFGGLFWIYYASGMSPAFMRHGVDATWPVLALHLCLVAGLLAATVIDARLYIIPLQIPWTITALALVVLPVAAHFHPAGTVATTHPIVDVNAGAVRAALGGWIGLIVAIALLRIGVIPRSFADEEELLGTASGGNQTAAPPDTAYAAPTEAAVPVNAEATAEVAPAPATEAVPQEQAPEHEAFLAYPHPRREVLKELLFVAIPIVGIVAGLFLLPMHGDAIPAWVRALSGAAWGYLVGGGVIWITRILGTLAFGKEAMGLGDVHLLAAIGAVLGPIDPLLIFFVAPFFGLAYAAAAIGVSTIAKGKVRIIPYGPYLALATVVIMVFRQQIIGFIF